MDRDSFNSLPISKQIGYFNDELTNEENNFNAICRNLGISKNTILGRFRKFEYEPVRQGQRIIGFTPQVQEEKQGENKLITKSVTRFSTKQNCSVENLISENSMMKNKKKASDPCEMNLILKRIELLEQKVEGLESANLRPDKELLNEDFRSAKDFINSYDTTTTKTFKIDIEVYEELEKVFNKYKMYKRQDIVSSLLKYALDNI